MIQRTTTTAFILSLTLLFGSASTFAQTTQVPTDSSNPSNSPDTIEYGEPITLDQAQAIVSRAVGEAKKNKWRMSIAIIDSSGVLRSQQTMDQTQTGSIDFAFRKAQTALAFRRPTKVFEDLVAKGEMHWRLVGQSDLLPIEGGLPIISKGKVIGAIGISGGSSQQDGQVANYAIKLMP
jgi:uncharacterized protein GlcG (DUF336 family)